MFTTCIKDLEFVLPNDKSKVIYLLLYILNKVFVLVLEYLFCIFSR